MADTNNRDDIDKKSSVGDRNSIEDKKDGAEDKATAAAKRAEKIRTSVEDVRNIIAQIALTTFHFTFSDDDLSELTKKVVTLIVQACADKTAERIAKMCPEIMMTEEERVKLKKI